MYGQSDPPEYKVSNVKVPVATYRGENDYLTAKEVGTKAFDHKVQKSIFVFQDYSRMLKEFPMLYDNFTIPYPDWNHVDFMWAVDTDTYLFPHLLKNLDIFFLGKLKFSLEYFMRFFQH